MSNSNTPSPEKQPVDVLAQVTADREARLIREADDRAKKKAAIAAAKSQPVPVPVDGTEQDVRLFDGKAQAQGGQSLSGTVSDALKETPAANDVQTAFGGLPQVGFGGGTLGGLVIQKAQPDPSPEEVERAKMADRLANWDANGIDAELHEGMPDKLPGWHVGVMSIFARMCSEHVQVTAEGKVGLAFEIATGIRRTRDQLALHANGAYGAAIWFTAKGVPIVKNYATDLFWKSTGEGVGADGVEVAVVIASHVVVEPTAQPATHVQCGPFNMWHEAIKSRVAPDGHSTFADIKIITDHVIKLDDGGTVAPARFWQWLGHLYQFPHIRQSIAPDMWSQYGGVGKSIIYELIKAVFGAKVCVVIPGKELNKSADFTSRLEGKFLVLIDEMERDPRRDMSGTIRNWITSDTVFFERKGIDAKEHKNIMNFCFNSNKRDALELLEGERRILPFCCTYDPKKDPGAEAHYTELVAWIRGPGPAMVANVLKNMDLTGYNPQAMAPQTESSRMLQEASRDPALTWLAARIANREGGFAKQIGRCEQFYIQLDGTHASYAATMRNYRISEQTLPDMLARLGYKRLTKLAKSGKPSTNPKARVWCVGGDPDWWGQQHYEVWDDYIMRDVVPEGMPPFGDEDDE